MTELKQDENPRILICDNVSEGMVSGLESEGFNFDYRPDITRKELLETIGDYHVVVVRSRTKIDSEVIEKAGRLKIIARAGIGVDNIDLARAEAKNIEVVTTKTAPTQSVVELNVGLAINLARKVVHLSSKLKEGEFRKEKGREISGSTCGIIGFGRIGYETARMLKAFGAKILAHDIVQNENLIKDVQGKYVGREYLLENSDFIFVCVTLNNSSKSLLGPKELSVLKKGSILINTSRAEAIDPQALLGALKDGILSAYGSDVLWNEPPSETWEKELIRMENVVVTPHIGSQTVEAQGRVALATLENIRKSIRGEN